MSSVSFTNRHVPSAVDTDKIETKVRLEFMPEKQMQKKGGSVQGGVGWVQKRDVLETTHW
jgi:hypothetical protein